MHRVKRTAVHPVSRSLSFLVVLLSIIVCPRSWVHAVPIDARIQAELVLSEDLSTLAGDATVHLVNRGQEPMTAVSLWLFPERLSVSPEGLDDVVLPRVFPNGFDAGGVELDSIRGGGEAELVVRPIRPGLVRVELSEPLSPVLSCSNPVTSSTATWWIVRWAKGAWRWSTGSSIASCRCPSP